MHTMNVAENGVCLGGNRGWDIMDGFDIFLSLNGTYTRHMQNVWSPSNLFLPCITWCPGEGSIARGCWHGTRDGGSVYVLV